MRRTTRRKPGREQVWTAAARLDAVLTTAIMGDAGKSAWCRAHGIFAQQLAAWRTSAPQALAEFGEARASLPQTQQARRCINKLERELLRKDRALAETAALLVLLKKGRGGLQHGRGFEPKLADKAGLIRPRCPQKRHLS